MKPIPGATIPSRRTDRRYTVPESTKLNKVRQLLTELASPAVTNWRTAPDDGSGPPTDAKGLSPVSLPCPLEGGDSAWFLARLIIPERHFGFDVANGPVTLKWSARQFAEAHIGGRFVVRKRGDAGYLPLSESARPGDVYDLAMRVAGHGDRQGGTSEGSDTGSGLNWVRVEYGALEEIRTAVNDLLERLFVCERLTVAAGTGSMALDQAVSGIDLSAIERGDKAAVLASVSAANDALAGLDDLFKRYSICLTANAHIDMAWLWDREETKQVCHDTFRSVLNLMNEYPDFIFSQSQAAAFAWVEEYWPEMFEEIRARVAEGRWEIVGGMWVEPDCNLPSGESFVRQVVYGKRYFMEKFGVDVTLGWNPDSFGYNYGMPQVYKKCGINAFLTQKLTWNDTNVWPLRAFWWESADDSRIFSYFPTDYTGKVLSNGLIQDLAFMMTATGAKRTCHLFGIGDHGGGPTRDMLDRADKLSALQPFPRVRHQRMRDFIDELQAELEDKGGAPVYRGELYLEYHRGTFTSQAAIKKGNRDAERLLRRLEIFATAAARLGAAYPAEAIDGLWKTTLFNQFHDILPGSCIGAAAQDAAEDYAGIRAQGSALLGAALDTLTGKADGAPASVAVFNGMNYRRTGVVTIPVSGGPYKVLDSDGREATCQTVTEKDGTKLLFLAEDVPATGWKTYRLETSAPSEADTGLRAGGNFLENQFVRVEIAGDGTFSRVYDKANAREVLAPGVNGNVLQAFVDTPGKWEAWEIARDFEANGEDLRGPVEMELVESGPVRARIRTTRRWSKSTFVQDITLTADSPRVDVVTHVDWQDRQRLLKVLFPVNVKSDVATYEVPYSAIERSTRNETTFEQAQFEVPALQWADMSADGFGVALMNDCKHGYDIKGNRMRLTLLRSPNSPDPNCDKGEHTFTYSLYPHAGDRREGQIYRAATDLNDPLFARACSHTSGDTASIVEIGPDNVLLSAMKLADDGDGVIVRFFETDDRDGEALLTFGASVSAAWETDMLEHNEKALTPNGNTLRVPLGHNEVKTLRVRFA
jgi:alpha-mannosidase